MERLTSCLDLKKDSILEIILNPIPSKFETCEAWYNSIRDRIIAEVDPLLKSYLEDLKLVDKYRLIETLPELEKQVIDHFPYNIRGALAELLDSEEGLTLTQRVWLFSVYGTAMGNAARKFNEAALVARAQEIAQRGAQQKSRIILN